VNGCLQGTTSELNGNSMGRHTEHRDSYALRHSTFHFMTRCLFSLRKDNFDDIFNCHSEFMDHDLIKGILKKLFELKVVLMAYCDIQ
jgi:hypothetical protein